MRTPLLHEAEQQQAILCRLHCSLSLTTDRGVGRSTSWLLGMIKRHRTHVSAQGPGCGALAEHTHYHGRGHEFEALIPTAGVVKQVCGYLSYLLLTSQFLPVLI